ncbi:hypothetical protein [Ruegeria sp. HKCCD7559]|uniref:hypothetical protein n=1 Tax=Ruegeria sp. HKCCD7559 TaxID=2683005 RepID=UPI0014923F0A|nr:hypothetical protein [Ruegeria sp. HKCCD7559]NOC47526.1 hypothetical protein [Ruegeria sp. HKCCD7559]
MELSDVIAGFALLVSASALIVTLRSFKSQSRLTDREIELVRIQIQQAQGEAKREKTASVSARLNRIDRTNWRLRVFNTGPATARNVRLLLDDQNQIVAENFANDKFPMSKLEKGQSVDLAAMVHMQTPPKEWLRITWEDPSGEVKENRVEITI